MPDFEIAPEITDEAVTEEAVTEDAVTEEGTAEEVSELAAPEVNADVHDAVSDAGTEAGAQEDALTEEVPSEEAPLPEDNRKWYIIHTYSGFERKVAESLRTRAEAFGFAGEIGQILIPEEEVVELRNGKKVTSKRLLYPGYVVVQMDMNDELWHRVKDTPRVTGFVGGGQTPVPLSADEINKMLYRQATAAERPARPKMTFEKNESVRIMDGPFANFEGKVDEINPERNTMRVLVTIFGRQTPVELDFLQVEKKA